jgi:hypothetical protein
LLKVEHLFGHIHKTAKRVCLSHLSTSNNSAPTGRIFMKFGIGVFHMKTNIHFWLYLAQFFLAGKNIWDESSRENQNTHFMFNNPPPQKKLCCLWDNVEKYCIDEQATDHNIIWCMHIACWITKTANTHSEYVILFAFPP